MLGFFLPASLAAMESPAFAGSSAAKAGHPAKTITKAQYKADAIRNWCFIINHVSFAPSPLLAAGRRISGHFTPTCLPPYLRRGERRAERRAVGTGKKALDG